MSSTQPIKQPVEQQTAQSSVLDNDSDSNSQGTSEKYDDKPPPIPVALIDNADLVTEKGNVVTKDGVVISTQESDASLSSNIFADPEVKAYYIGVYEKANYECRHVFDAEVQWTPEEEKALVRRLDWHGIWASLRATQRKYRNIFLSSVSLGMCHVLQSPSRSIEPHTSSVWHIPTRPPP